MKLSVYDFYITPEEYEAAKRNGVEWYTLESRIRDLGWNKRDAITKPPESKMPFNKKYVALAEENGISYTTFRFRVRRYGMTEYEAATKPLQNRSEEGHKLKKINQKYPDEILNLMKENGIPYSTFIMRIKRSKWTPYKAATHPVMSRSEVGKIAKPYMEKKYKR